MTTETKAIFKAYKWHEDISAKVFSPMIVKAGSDVNTIRDGEDSDSSMNIVSSGEATRISKGEWVVLLSGGSFVGVFTDEQFKKEFKHIKQYEIMTCD